VWPLPVVERALGVVALVRAAGWAGARALSDAVFEGWEVDFLGHALAEVEAFDRRHEVEAERQAVERMRRRG
jgi:hypothetical protein